MTTRAVGATIDSTRFAKDICAAINVDPALVTRLEIVIDWNTDKPFTVKVSLVADRSILDVALPTIEEEERQQLLSLHRERIEAIA